MRNGLESHILSEWNNHRCLYKLCIRFSSTRFIRMNEYEWNYPLQRSGLFVKRTKNRYYGSIGASCFWGRLSVSLVPTGIAEFSYWKSFLIRRTHKEPASDKDSYYFYHQGAAMGHNLIYQKCTAHPDNALKGIRQRGVPIARPFWLKKHIETNRV